MGLSKEARIQRDTIEEEMKARLAGMLSNVDQIYAIRGDNYRHVALLYVDNDFSIVDITNAVARLCRFRTTAKRGWIMLPRGWSPQEVVDYMTGKVGNGKITTEVLR